MEKDITFKTKYFKAYPFLDALVSTNNSFFWLYDEKIYLYSEQQDIMICIDWVLERKTERNLTGKYRRKGF